MKHSGLNLLALLLRDFFSRQLPNLRGMSAHTIQSYRDSLVLLLRFVASRKKNRSVSTLDLEDLRVEDVQSFLDYLERERGNTVTTRNVRLSALHSFFRFVAAERPDRLEHAQRVLGVPFKRTHSRRIDYLEYEEIEKTLSAIDRSNPKGRRDYTLLATMFNTGARVQEILDLKACNLRLAKPYQVQLTGKGRKQRCCPLWPQTARLLRDLCRELELEPSSETPVFQNCRGAPLTRFGVRYILAESLRRAQASMPGLASKRLHPHSLRHSTAVALLKSGADLSTIGQWLGHESPNTTGRYAVVDLDMKRKAISRVKPLQAQGARSAPWRHNRTILEWLESL